MVVIGNVNNSRMKYKLLSAHTEKKEKMHQEDDDIKKGFTMIMNSRIHCALPCLSIETSVIYTDYSSRTCIDGCRLGGLKALFNIICWDNGRLAKNFDFQGLISADNCPANSGLWKKYRDDL